MGASIAYRAIMEDAFTVVPHAAVHSEGRRKGLGEYIKLGYIPVGHNVGDEVAATLNYALADYSMSLAAEHVGDKNNATILKGRARKAWRELWNPAYKGGFFMPKWEDGTWDSPFDEFAWEGNP